MASMMGGGGDSGLGGLGALLILRFAAPLAALWLVWAAWAGKAERLPMLVTGAATIVAALLVVLVRQAVLSAVPDMARDMMASQIHLGLGVMPTAAQERPDACRVGQEGFSTCSYRWRPSHSRRQT